MRPTFHRGLSGAASWVILGAMLAACSDPSAACPPCASAAAAAGATATASAGGVSAETTSGGVSSASAQDPSIDLGAELSFVKGGKTVRKVRLGELLGEVKEERLAVYDPYYNREKTFRGLPLAEVVRRGFQGSDGALPAQEYVLRARDGYTVPMRGSRVFEDGAYVAFADVDVPGWEPIGQQRANPGPFYLVWRKKEQQSLETHPRPWQLASIEIARFEDLFPHTVPSEGKAAAARGFGIFKEQCVHCHAINREGGRVGPELNVPKSIVEYRPIDQIKAYVRDPMQFRYGNMPAHPFLSDTDLDDLVVYLQDMKERKHDPAQKETGKK
ncbi:MAG: cytochrome c [Polyangiaceae bacterium]